jgi:hypothetical protein
MPHQHSTSVGRSWDQDPDHDRRVIDAIVGNASMAELAEIRRQVAAEYARAAAERQPSAVMWRTRGGHQLVDGSGGAEAPVQHTVTHDTVPGLATDDRPSMWKD